MVLFLLPDVPIQRKVKLPVILTPLSTENDDRFFSKTNGEGAESTKHDNKDKSNTNNDHSEHAHDAPKPRMTEDERPTQSGTDFKAQHHKPSAHYEITSPGLRWTAHDLRTGPPNEKRERYKKKKTASQRTDDVEEDTKEDDDPGESRSSVNFAAVGAGIMVFLFIFAGLARLWYVENLNDFPLCLGCIWRFFIDLSFSRLVPYQFASV